MNHRSQNNDIAFTSPSCAHDSLNVTAMSASVTKRTPTEEKTDPRVALIERITNSPSFGRSRRLSEFLQYIGEMTIAGRAEEINEQKIGEAVFGRPLAYDSSIDGIVRTQASRLRQRLEMYFANEGALEPLRIVVPRGGYVPRFEALAPPVEEQVSKPLGPVPALQRQPGRTLLPWTLATLFAVALAVALIWPQLFQMVPPKLAPRHPFWSLILDPGQPTLAVSGDSGLVLWQGVTKRTLGLAEYLSGGYRVESQTAVATIPNTPPDLASRRYTTVVDLEIVHELDHIANREKSRIDVRFARDVRPNDLKKGNIVLVGASEANPWVGLFEPKMNFQFGYDRHALNMSVINRNPINGEPSHWDSNHTDAQHRVYGVLAYLPNLSSNGRVLILEGTTMAGTECVWNFVSDDTQLLPFLERIRRPDKSVPPFEVVLGASNLSGSAAKANVLAWRVAN